MKMPKYMTAKPVGRMEMEISVRWWGVPIILSEATRGCELAWYEWPIAVLLIAKTTIDVWVDAIKKQVNT